MKLIHTQHLCKRAGGRLVLDGVSLEIEAGCIYGLFGRNGSGKTSLLTCLAGLDAPTSGEIASHSTTTVACALPLPGLAPELTLAENLSFFAALARVPARRRASRVAHLIQDFGLTAQKNARAGGLSSGVTAKGELARAFVSDANLILIDGLLDGLDRESLEQVWRLVTARRRQQNTAFVISTARAEVAERCDLAMVMDKGRLLAAGKPAELKSSARPDTVLVDVVRNPLLKSKIKKRFAACIEDADGMLKFRTAEGLSDVMDILVEHGSDTGAVYLRQPTLEDVLDDLAGRPDDV